MEFYHLPFEEVESLYLGSLWGFTGTVKYEGAPPVFKKQDRCNFEP